MEGRPAPEKEEKKSKIMAEEKVVLYEVKEEVAWVTLNRPARRNSLSDELIQSLSQCLAEADGRREVRVVVLTGAGEKAFCAGADLAGGVASAAQEEGLLGTHYGRRIFTDLLLQMQRLGKPIVGRINGHALGGGLGLALSCDIAIASEKAKLGTPEAKIGLFPMMIMPLIFRHIGRKRGLEMILTGQRLSAEEAVAAGMLNRAVPAEELDEATAEVCQRLIAGSPATLRLGRETFYRIAEMPLEQALAFALDQFTLNTMLEDAQEGILAFFEKREPEWKGR